MVGDYCVSLCFEVPNGLQGFLQRCCQGGYTDCTRAWSKPAGPALHSASGWEQQSLQTMAPWPGPTWSDAVACEAAAAVMPAPYPGAVRCTGANWEVHLSPEAWPGQFVRADSCVSLTILLVSVVLCWWFCIGQHTYGQFSCVHTHSCVQQAAGAAGKWWWRFSV